MCITIAIMYKTRIRNVKSRSGRHEKYRDTVYPSDDQDYAVVTDMLGNGRVKVMINDVDDVYIGRICGSMRKYKSKVIIERGDLVIVSKRDFEPSKVDVVHKYAHDEVSSLIYQRMLPEKLMKHLTKADNEGDEYIMFANDDEVDVDAI